ncbi:MAG TPA: DUF3237 domain-containing protein [Candidatus Eisenbacteria bacterium]|nr:DUF3237 domain-containing protein [Candidatus Eisenbacteria bacterium]
MPRDGGDRRAPRVADHEGRGDTRSGLRRIIPITDGRVEGPRFSGEVLPGGADWQIVRVDGGAELEARYTVRTPDGALVYVRNIGLRCGPPEVLARLGRGEVVDPATYYFRTTPRFETGAPAHAWLNDVIAVGSAVRRADAVILDFYVVA